MSSSITDQYALVGRVRKPHGLKGHVTVELLTDRPDAVFASGMRVLVGNTEGDILPQQPELIVESSSYFKEGMVVKFDKINDRNTSELWRHRYLLIPINELPEPEDGEVFLHELIGMTVNDPDESSIGEIVETYELPQGVAIEVKLKDDSTVLVPFIDEYILSADRHSRIVVVETATGIFE